VPIAGGVIFAVATAIGSAPSPKVCVRPEGQDRRPGRQGEWIDLSGKVTVSALKVAAELFRHGHRRRVAIKGKVTTDDRTLSRDFGASGRLTEGR